MTKSKKTKRALLGSVLALVLCFVMLLGTTFAWFTDTASTGVNKIQAGTLKVDIVDKAGTSVNGQTLNFLVASEEGEEGEGDEDGTESKEILWEPNCTYTLPAVKVVNNGNLALKFKVVFTPVVNDEHKGGEKLAEVLEVLVNGENTGLTLKDVLESTDSDGVLHGNLLPKGETDTVNGKKLSDTSDEYTVSLHMKETAGNEYQGLCIDAIAVTVYATQWTYEYDSINNTYDEGATYDEPVRVTEYEAILPAMKAGKDIVLQDDILVDYKDKYYEDYPEELYINGYRTPIRTTIDLNGHNLKYVNHHPNGHIFRADYDAEITINGSGKVEAECASILATWGGKIIINGGDYTVTGSATEGVAFCYGGAVIEINGGTFKHNNSPSCTLKTYSTMGSNPGLILIKGGSFYKFDPSQYDNSNFSDEYGVRVADGYHVVQDGDWYTVVPDSNS